MIRKNEFDDLILKATGLKCEEFTLETEEVELPYITYIVANPSFFNADGINYFSLLSTTLHLINDSVDKEIEDKIEAMFLANETAFQKETSFDEDIRVYITEYSFTLLQ